MALRPFIGLASLLTPAPSTGPTGPPGTRGPTPVHQHLCSWLKVTVIPTFSLPRGGDPGVALVLLASGPHGGA
jgi:hypothetical protein